MACQPPTGQRLLLWLPQGSVVSCRARSEACAMALAMASVSSALRSKMCW